MDSITLTLPAESVEMILQALQARESSATKKSLDTTRAADYRLHWANKANEFSIVSQAIQAQQ